MVLEINGLYSPNPLTVANNFIKTLSELYVYFRLLRLILSVGLSSHRRKYEIIFAINCFIFKFSIL